MLISVSPAAQDIETTHLFKCLKRRRWCALHTTRDPPARLFIHTDLSLRCVCVRACMCPEPEICFPSLCVHGSDCTWRTEGRRVSHCQQATDREKERRPRVPALSFGPQLLEIKPNLAHLSSLPLSLPGVIESKTKRKSPRLSLSNTLESGILS